MTDDSRDSLKTSGLPPVINQQVFTVASASARLTKAAFGFVNLTKKFESSLIPEYSLQQIEQHASPKDCWIVIYDKVYDVTDFIVRHPGGFENLLEYAGRDATLAFRGVGHSEVASTELKRRLIGILVQQERIYSHL